MKRPLSAVCLVLILGMAVMQALHPPAAFSYAEAAGSRVYLTGRVCERSSRSDSISLIVAPRALSYQTPDNTPGEEIPFQNKILCYMEEAADVPIGSLVLLSGTLKEWEAPSCPGQFDAPLYYRIQGISAKLLHARLEDIEPPTSGIAEFFRQLLRAWQEGDEPPALGMAEFFRQLRDGLCERLDACFGEKTAGILKTMLLGDKSGLLEETQELYREAGILHILAISGLHISLIGMGLYRLLKRLRLPTFCACLLCGASMLFYGVLVGMPVSAVRAIAMFLLRLLADCCKRTYDMLTALSVCAAGMLLANPLYLYHSGFQLSFGAVLSIVLLKPALLPEQAGNGLESGLTDAFFTSLSVSVLTLPIQLSSFYQIPVYGVFLNLAVIPLVSWLMLCGMGGLLLGGGFGMRGLAVAERIGKLLFNIPAEWILAAYEAGASAVRGLPGSIWTPGAPKPWQICVFCVILALVLWGKRHGLAWRCRMGLVCGAVLVFGIREYGQLRITFLDVGQGDCICVELPDGVTWLFDGGSSSVRGLSAYRLLPFLQSRGIDRLDAVFLSHGDADHINGVEELLETDALEIGLLVLPAAAQKKETGEASKAKSSGKDGFAENTGTDGFDNILELAEEQEIPVLWLAQGMTWESGGVSAVCLHPSADFSGGDTNEASMVVKLSYGSFSLLLTGDVEGAGEECLLACLKEQSVSEVTVLKTAHHGSGGTTSQALLRQVSPRVAVISCGRNNTYGHPHEETLSRLREVDAVIYRTDESGTVTVTVRDGRVQVEEYLRRQDRN